MATWAKGLDFKNSDNTKRIGGVGIYGTDSSLEKLYIGLGTEPWNNAGLQLTNSAINFKGNKIYHAGDKPTLSELGAAASSHTHSYIPLSGSTGVTGTLRSNSEIQTTSQNAFRAVSGNYGFFIRNDGSNTYFLLTNSGDQYGNWNSLRPLSVNNATGVVTFGNGLKGTLDGNASTSTTLQNARTLTIGKTGKSFNGSANVSWSTDEIGALDKNNDSTLASGKKILLGYSSSWLTGDSSAGTVTLRAGGNLFIHGDADTTSSSEYVSIKAGNNDLRVISSAASTGQDKLTFNGNIVYHAGRKPTLSELGAAASNHNHNGIYVNDKANVSGNMNNAAGYRNALGMINLSGTDATINPNGQTGWHHFINMSYSESSGSNMWQTQIANKAGTTDLWVRSRAGSAITDGTAWAAPWTRILTGSNYKSVVTPANIGAATSSHNHTSLTSVTSIGGAGASSSWGSLNIAGSKGGWAGIHFSDTKYVFLVNNEGHCGIWKDAGNAIYSFDKNGALVNGTVGWDKITGKPSTYAPSSHNHTALIGTNDTRSKEYTPATCPTDTKVTFQSNGTNGVNDGGNFYSLMHIPRWSHNSGGYGSQFAFTDNGNVWYRKGISDTSWSEWRRIWHSGNFDPNTKFQSGGTYGTVYLTDWFRAKGNTGLYFQDWGGGWYMTDSTWIRAYNGKNIYTEGVMNSKNGFQWNGQSLDSRYASSSHTHSYLPLSGGTMTGAITSSVSTSTHINGNKGTAIINSTASGSSYNMLAKMNSTNGVWTMGSWGTNFCLFYTANSVINAGTNGFTKQLTLLNESGNASFPGTVTASGSLNSETINATSTIATNGAVTAKGTITGYTINATNGMSVAGSEVCAGKTSAGSYFKRVPVIGSDGAIEVGRYMDWHYSGTENKDYHLRLEVPDWACLFVNGGLRVTSTLYPNSNGGIDVGQSGTRFRTVYCTTVNQSSDKKYKEDIVYLDDVPTTISNRSTNTNIFKKFITDDLKIASYKFVQPEVKAINDDDENYPFDQGPKPWDNQIGFIAQDVYETEVGKHFVYEENGDYSFSPSGFTTVIARALQEEIRERDEQINSLKEQNQMLLDRLAIIEEKIGLQ